MKDYSVPLHIGVSPTAKYMKNLNSGVSLCVGTMIPREYTERMRQRLQGKFQKSS